MKGLVQAVRSGHVVRYFDPKAAPAKNGFLPPSLDLGGLMKRLEEEDGDEVGITAAFSTAAQRF